MRLWTGLISPTGSSVPCYLALAKPIAIERGGPPARLTLFRRAGAMTSRKGKFDASRATA
jgi:hypothetical protein